MSIRGSGCLPASSPPDRCAPGRRSSRRIAPWWSGLLPVDHEVAAVALGGGPQRGEVGARAGLGEIPGTTSRRYWRYAAGSGASAPRCRTARSPARPWWCRTAAAPAPGPAAARREDVLLHRRPAGAAHSTGQCGTAQPLALRMRCQVTMSSFTRRWPSTIMRRIAAGSASRMNARTSSRNAISSGVKRRSMGFTSLSLSPQGRAWRRSEPGEGARSLQFWLREPLTPPVPSGETWMRRRACLIIN